MWDYDQHFKILLERLNFISKMSNIESGLLSDFYHTFGPTDITEGHNLVERCGNHNALRVYVGGGETLIGLVQVQSQLVNLTMQLQDMAKTKVGCENVWCTGCLIEGHHQNECLALGIYTTMDVLNPFPTWTRKNNGVRSVDNGAMYLPIVQHCRSIRRLLTPFCEFISRWAMM
jgi:hypothetical protein